jgi:signal transduction histidine kinase
VARTAIAVGISALAVAVGVFSLDVARDVPGYWFAGTSAAAGVAFLAAGWGLVACGLAFWLRRPASRFGLLLAASGFAWFLPEWNNPTVGSSLAFTVGLCLYGACPPLVGHAVLVYPGGRLRSPVRRAAVAVAYVGGVLVLGVLPALVYDPGAQSCWQCPTNLLLISDRSDVWADLNRVGLYIGLAWAIVLAALAALRLVRASSWARAVFAAGTAYLVLVGAWFAASRDRGLLEYGTTERRLWLAQAGALLALMLGVAWNWVRARRARSSVARWVIGLAQSPPPGGLRDVLAGIIDDPELVLAYPLGDSGDLVDADGRRVEAAAGQERTTLVRDGRGVAVLAHGPGLLDDEQLVEEVTAAAGLALGNERLQAEVQARLQELRESRSRIVEAGDAERKRLERDLHDGAQQRLVGLSLSLRLARSRLPDDHDPNAVARLEEAERELRRAIAELRELAHGIFPAVLADEGLAAAIEALAEDGRVPMLIRTLPDERFAPPAESAAYTVVAETVRGATSSVLVDAERVGDMLRLEVGAQDLNAVDVVALEDRLGALDGRLAVLHREDGWVTIRAELPCES